MQAATSDHPLALDAWGAHWLEEIDRLTGEKKKAFVAASFKRAIEAIKKGMREKWETADAPETAWVARAQLLMARAHGFENWDVFTDLIAPAPGQSEEALAFESAVDAVVEGDLKVLQSLVGQFPALVETRSTRTHQAALLHYIAANGVEDFRQRTPGNAVEMAGYLLASGAEVDALANTYGGGKTQTPMNLLVSSAHPSAAGLMAPLVEVLLHFGAAIHGLENNGSPLRTALASGYLDGAEALVRGGARIDTLVAVASLGRLNLVDSFFSRADGVEQGRALVDASRFGQTEMVANLLDRAKYDGCAQSAQRANLLTPITKAFMTDRGLDACITAQQVFGGHGYVKEWGMEQLVRDVRIAQIYEGTNGIQAADFMLRKVASDQAAVLLALLNDIQLELKAHPTSISVVVEKRITQLIDVSHSLLAQEQNVLSMNACDYLDAVGYVLYAYMWQRNLMALNPAKHSADFVAAKTQTAMWYTQKVLPKVDGLFSSLQSDGSAMFALTEDQF